MKKILFVVLILLFPISVVDAYYMEYLDFVWSGPPLICVWDSDYNRHATEAITIWQDALYDSYGDGYDFLGTIITPETEWEIIELCRILVVYVEIDYVSVDDLDGITGIMLNDHNNNYVVAYVYEARPQLFATLEDYDDAVIKTTMHEIGHAFGLGHIKAENAGEAIKPWPQTLMWMTSGALEKNEIDYVTLEGFQHLYKSGNWSENPVLPHEYQLKVEFPERLDSIPKDQLTISFS